MSRDHPEKLLLMIEKRLQDPLKMKKVAEEYLDNCTDEMYEIEMCKAGLHEWNHRLSDDYIWCSNCGKNGDDDGITCP